MTAGSIPHFSLLETFFTCSNYNATCEVPWHLALLLIECAYCEYETFTAEPNYACPLKLKMALLNYNSKHSDKDIVKVIFVKISCLPIEEKKKETKLQEPQNFNVSLAQSRNIHLQPCCCTLACTALSHSCNVN